MYRYCSLVSAADDIPALNGEVLRTKHDKFFIKHCLGGCHAYWLELFK